MRKSMRCFLLTGGIDKMNLCVVGIKMHHYLVFCLDYFNTLKSVLYIEQLAIGSLIILNTSMII